MKPSNALPQQPAGVFRRFAAMFYDAFLLFAVLMASLMIAVALNSGEMVPRVPATLIVLLVNFSFFSFFWKRGGQTLGMKTWHLRLVSNNGGNISTTQCAWRVLGAALSLATAGLGYFWQWIDKDQRTLPDIISGTRVMYQPKNKNT